MQLNVAQLLKEPIGSIRVYDIDEQLDNRPAEEDVSSLQGQVKLLRTDKGVLVTVILEDKTMVTCARCLSPFEYQMRLDIKEEYFTTVDIASSLSLPGPDEPDTFTIDENHTIDLDEAVRQYSLMSLPLKPLCQEYCAGLCPSCGKSLNEGPCQCKLDSDSNTNFILSTLSERQN